MSSRDVVLNRVRRALADVPREERAEDHAVPRDYLPVHGERTPAQTAGLLAENLADYRAVVHRTSTAQLPHLLGQLLSERGARSVLLPEGLPGEWLTDLPGDLERLPDSLEYGPHDLDAVDSVLTGCAVAIAETGTVVLDAGPGQGRRRVTLVPDHHICVVRVPEQVAGSVPEGLARLDPAHPLTWISGPSATSDIELDRVEGVHGPRTLEVVLAGE
ncbi:LUD domain-containing protein [Streptomyces sp. ODS28]|uniref:LutC/YkgG family protein n=1 Tax=Streptomyces sp. ODS28 TaxID=3136688 RepID=UPI0031E53015